MSGKSSHYFEHWIQNRPKGLRKVFEFDSSVISKLVFLNNYQLNFFHQILNLQLFCREFWIENFMNLFFGLAIWYLENAKDGFRFGHFFVSELKNLCNYWRDFLHQGMNLEFLLLVHYLTCICWFCSMYWYPDGAKRLESATSFDSPRHSNSDFLSSSCFIFPSRCQSEAFLSIEGLPLE